MQYRFPKDKTSLTPRLAQLEALGFAATTFRAPTRSFPGQAPDVFRTGFKAIIDIAFGEFPHGVRSSGDPGGRGRVDELHLRGRSRCPSVSHRE